MADADEVMERRRAAILAADLCGYSRLVAEDPENTLAQLLADRRLIGDTVSTFAGRVFNTAGDAVLAEFPSAADAFRAAVHVQRSIEARGSADARARRMRYRIGIAIGDVVDQAGDVLGDPVNVASRLEKLAKPGGICLTRAAHQGAGDAVFCPVADIGPQRLKNMPQPIPACLVAPEAIGTSPGPGPARTPVPAVAVGIAAVAAVVAVLSAHRAPSISPARAAVAPDTFVFSPEPEMPAATSAAPRRPLAAAEVPFVTDAIRARIAAAAAADPGVAVAIGQRDAIGLASPDEADSADRAVRACFEAGGINCRLYAIGGEVVWPDPPPPMPAEPWVEPSVSPTPFAVDRIAGLSEVARRRLGEVYPSGKAFKALALGPRGIWQIAEDRGSAAQAERAALERCGERVGSPCRIVAVGDSFVVALRKP